jgi:hypothetical protein
LALKSLESPNLHHKELRARILAEVHGAPAELLDPLQSENRRMNLGDDCYIGEIEFHRLTDVKEVTWRVYRALHVGRVHRQSRKTLGRLDIAGCALH